jgi:hypothetical protein
VFMDFALHGFRVTIVADTERTAEVSQVEKAVGEIVKTKKGLLQLVSDAKNAEVAIRLDRTGQYLDVRTRGGKPFKIDVKPGDSRFADLLAENLENLHRASNLIAVASRFDSNGVVGLEPAVKIHVEIVILRKGANKAEIVKWPSVNPVLYEGDKVQLKLTNGSESTRVDASVLIVDPDYQITPFYPLKGGQAPKALAPGDSVTTAPATVVGPFGLEKVIVIAMAATSPQVDFTRLAQSGFRERGYNTQTPVAMLLENAMYRKGSQRGITLEAGDLHAMKVIAWRCEEAVKQPK